jgi:hypothetical protein
MYKFYFVIAFSAVLMISAAQTSQAAFLYSKPEFHGRVIDSETKEPIAGAVVVVLYYKRSTFSLNPGGPSSFVTKAKETLTDKQGEFFFPRYSELMWLNEDVGARFIFFKPGYHAGYGPAYIAPLLTEKYFMIAKDKVGTEGMITYVDRWDRKLTFKGLLGIVELKKARTREEKLRTMPSPPANYTSKELPILIKFINSEINNLGLKGEYK